LFHSLFLKVSLSVGAVVTLTLTLFAYFIIENQKEHLLEAKKGELGILSTLVRKGIINFMKEGKARDVHNFLTLLAIQEGQWELRILDPGGKVLRSARKEEEGTFMEGLLPRQPATGRTPLIFEQKILGRPFLSATETLANEAACFPCHGKDKKNLGILYVGFPMENTQRSLTFNRNLLIFSTAITLVLMAAAVNLLLTRLVRRPIGLLTETMSQVERGDLNVEVSLATEDELGRLAKSFNSMVQKLSQAQKELERQHQQQMLQVRHLASLGELAASVVHEVKNPLAGIKLAIQVLAKEPELSAGHRGTIEEIMHSVERLDKTMADLLSYSRMRPPELQPVSLHEVLEVALSFIKEECQIAGVRVEKQFDSTLPPLALDSGQMERAFLNLFLNALQAMPGGGRLTIQTKVHKSGDHLREGFPIFASSGQEAGWAEVSVTDTGEGIQPEVLGEIFRPFFTTKAKGTGLGLSLAQRIIEQHQGQIFAESRVGVGTTFYLRLPIPSPASRGECC